ncbi:expressed unknown protein [Seminavis robusta]|uniref:PDZ domain-containing protein n=1 Tax=Seminavis robusta TaxID=568900 RepID=A0A9N8EB79_9STRA|nr:expressed unknown protein [Seminavis robusta]|eukprot:Sro755_g197550.1 n/a (1396) ;mRNA; f:4350-9326
MTADNTKKGIYTPGTVVETMFGVGVVVSHRGKIGAEEAKEGDQEDVPPMVEVRLWRAPGHSIGTAATAFLQPSMIKKQLPVAPGMTTTTIEDIPKKVLVHCYNPSQEKYLVSVAQLQPTKGSKFYPLLLELMSRGDRAVAQAGGLWMQNKDKIQDAALKLAETGEKLGEELQTKAKEVIAETPLQQIATTNIEQGTADATTAAETAVETLKTIFKNEHRPRTSRKSHDHAQGRRFHVLLENGKQRLEQLVQADIPHATEEALSNLGITWNTETSGARREQLEATQQKALEAVDDLLASVQQAAEQFDNFVEASKSDRHLSSIMEHVSSHTTEWQQMTGRLLSTKSGSLFLEGASRIQARAGLILSGGQFGQTVDLQEWTQSMTTKFTKAFTEGDAAVARLKSIELGDATLQKRITKDNISKLLSNLQTSADGKRKEAHETLISVLSRKSVYRDIALLKLERTFCDLEEQFFGADWNSEDAWSAEDLAKLARGEGGTANLFEPIAKRAKQEIDKQLDHAEETVRKQQEAKGGMTKMLNSSGGLVSSSMNAIVEDVVTLLNDDKIVAQGENLIQRGERFLDAIEGVANMDNINDPTNRLVSDAMKVAEKAGITKESIMKDLEKINVDEVLDTAQGAVTDEKKRLLLLSQATDAALDFFLKILPSMPVPPFEGSRTAWFTTCPIFPWKDSRRATTDKRKSVKSLEAAKKAVRDMPKEAAAGTPIEAPDSGSSLLQEESNDEEEFQEADLDITTTSEIGHIKATELLIIDISDVAAVMDGATWNFEQTYFPYLKGKGISDVRMVNGCVRLQFELRKRKRKIQVEKVAGEEGETEEKEIWEPVLCLHDRSCTIGEVFVSLQGEGRVAWLLNKLADFFKGPVGTYVARQIVAVLSNKSGVILDKLNNVLSPYWDLILSTAGLKMDDLVEADHRVVTAADAEDNENTVELVWRERLPLGLNLLLNDESGQVKVVDLPRGSQARKVCEARMLDPEVFKGATIVAVNGCRFFEPEEVYDALRDPIRPKTVLFELAESEEAERVQEFVADAMNEKERKIKEAATGTTPLKEQSTNGEPTKGKFATHTYEITQPGHLGIEFGEAPDNFGLVVTGFVPAEDGTAQAAESSGKIHRHDLLTHINDKLVIGENGTGREKAFEILQSEGSSRPLTLTFSPPYLIRQVFEASATERKPTSAAQQNFVWKNGILIGDYLIFINGTSVGAGSRWLGEGPAPTLEEVYGILRDPQNYPMGLTFARPRQTENDDKSWSFLGNNKQTPQKDEKNLFNDEDSETVAVSTERLELLGCVFDVAEGTNDIVVTDFYAVSGYFQNTLSPVARRDGSSQIVKLAVESIDGQFVPTYASKDMVLNAIKRSWSKERRVEVLFSDDACKQWVHSLMATPETSDQ